MTYLTQYFSCFGTQIFNVTFFDDFTFSELFNLVIEITCVCHFISVNLKNNRSIEKNTYDECCFAARINT